MVSASESAFHLGMIIGAGLMLLGGLISLLGVRNPERPPELELERRRGPGPAATAGECGRVAEPSEPSPVPGALTPEPAGAGAPDAAL